MDSQKYIDQITAALNNAVKKSKSENSGVVADYIPELANVDYDYTAASIRVADGELISVNNLPDYRFTMQSVSKLITFIGLREELGTKVYDWIGTEPSGQHFSSISHLDRFGPTPGNPLINAGAISLCSHIPGNSRIERLAWVDKWMTKLWGTNLEVNQDVFHSELKTADKNRSLAYLMRSTGVITTDVEETLYPYFSLCSYELTIEQATYLPMLLANGGLDCSGKRIISEETAKEAVAIMATCGLYDESGTYLLQTGMPAKSGVSGLMIAVATGRGGIAVFNPKLNDKGGSVRGHIILEEISKVLDWHFAAPWGYARIDSKLHIDDRYA